MGLRDLSVPSAAALCVAALVLCGCPVPLDADAERRVREPVAIEQGLLAVTDLAPPEHLDGRGLLYHPEDHGEQTGVEHVTTIAFDDEDTSLDDVSGGFAVLDCDRDGDADLVFSDGTGDNQLFVNDGAGRFDVAPGAGVALPGELVAGLSVADWDRDDDPDLLVLVQHGQNRLLANDGACHFEDVTEDVGLDDEHRSVYASWVDWNGDGWLDLYVCNWGTAGVGGPPNIDPEPDRFWMSDGAGGFVDRTAELPEATRVSFGMMVAFLDHDEDGDLDLYLWNDRGSLAAPARLYRNDGVTDEALELVDVSVEAGFDLAEDGMDLVVADFDEDGDADLALTGGVETVLVDHGDHYVDSGAALGLTDTSTVPFSWAATDFDPDADGDPDLFWVESWFFDDCQDCPEQYGDDAVLMRNQVSTDGRFARLPLTGTLGQHHTWRGAAAVDLNGDGLEDLVTSSGDEPARLFFANPSQTSAVVQVRLHGSVSNTEGRHAVLRLQLGDRRLVRWPGAAPPYSSGQEPWVTFGLDGRSTAGPLEVTWPSGAVQVIGEVEAGTRLDLFEPR